MWLKRLCRVSRSFGWARSSFMGNWSFFQLDAAQKIWGFCWCRFRRTRKVQKFRSSQLLNVQSQFERKREKLREGHAQSEEFVEKESFCGLWRGGKLWWKLCNERFPLNMVFNLWNFDLRLWLKGRTVDECKIK
jgi:hypothetical protein